MASAQWPDLGRYLAPLEERPRPVVRRTEMDDGFVKQREAATRQMVEHPVRLRMTAAEYGQWKTWYRDTVDHGTAWFDWTDPGDGATKEALIRGGQFSARSRRAEPGAAIEWEVSMTLETWDA